MKTLKKKWFVIVAMSFMICLTGMIMTGTAFADRCVDKGDGIVTDNGTGLMWQKITAGPMDWDQAMSYASGLSLEGHSGWWLPTKDELLSLYNSPCKDMMDERNNFYWSSDAGASGTNKAWRFSFLSGYSYGGSKSDSYYVRAVRSAQ